VDINEREEREKHKREKRHEHYHEGRPKYDQEDSGDDPTRHAKIIARRWLGSPPPTPERYAQAVQQWHALPGAVVRPATDETTAETPTNVSPVPTGSVGQEGES
jgi:hypothetical protein